MLCAPIRYDEQLFDYNLRLNDVLQLKFSDEIFDHVLLIAWVIMELY